MASRDSLVLRELPDPSVVKERRETVDQPDCLDVTASMEPLASRDTREIVDSRAVRENVDCPDHWDLRARRETLEPQEPLDVTDTKASRETVEHLVPPASLEDLDCAETRATKACLDWLVATDRTVCPVLRESLASCHHLDPLESLAAPVTREQRENVATLDLRVSRVFRASVERRVSWVLSV